ncbi:esterase-like activity of phytase family protein [Salinarimonas soli]|uniref:Twin-arginine translocation pathway signal n=1 Tax=Salinarimonas soli TaxID=1638099 RepID=A0A5B2VF83_9HYPH|nr:esterase-like activity of phytase family protein [Salinarimonas soli]KAA2237100.1 twin-arginine translocation pathway signal [Salinarimonas soli]
MRLTRRACLALGGGAAAAALAVRHAAFARPNGVPGAATPIEVRATPITAFGLGERDGRQVGSLLFRGGAVLRSAHPAFGGLSGLWRSSDGTALVAVTDAGAWLTATVVSDEEGRFAGLEGARLSPILGPGGAALADGPAYDTESLAIADGVAYVGIERVHQVMRFDWAGAGVLARGTNVPVPGGRPALSANKSFEAVGVVPKGGALAGAVIAVAERAGAGEATPTHGYILTGPQRGRFEVARSGDFEITDLAFLPSGEVLLLERRFTMLTGPAVRIRRIAADAIHAGALVDGPVIFQADAGYQIDNMEGLAVHRDGAATILTLVSDDNFSMIQRTLLLEFELVG